MNDVWSFGMYMAPTSLPNGIVDEPYLAAIVAKEGAGPLCMEIDDWRTPARHNVGNLNDGCPVCYGPAYIGWPIHLHDEG